MMLQLKEKKYYCSGRNILPFRGKKKNGRCAIHTFLDILGHEN
jgi:hypothetical protein